MNTSEFDEIFRKSSPNIAKKRDFFLRFWVCTCTEGNFKFSGNAQLLVHCSVHRKVHLTVHCGQTGEWHKDVKNMNLF